MSARPRLAELQALKAAAFDAGPDPTLLLNGEGALIAANEAGEGLFAQSLGAIARGGLAAVLEPDSPLMALIGRCSERSGAVSRRDLRVAVFGRPAFVADVSATLLDGETVLVNFVPRTSAPASERAADGLHSAVGLGRLLAHEVKNPLAGIRGAAQLLKDGLAAADLPLAQLIVDETERIRRLIDRMTIFSEAMTPERTPVNIHRVLDRARALVVNGAAEGVAIQEDYDPSLPPALADADQLIQVFLNLLKNAAEAARSRGDGQGGITIATAFRHGARSDHDPAIPPRAAPLEVKVIDNGPGVAAELREHLFEPFVTNKTHGSGLGLALVAKLVSGNGGAVDFDSAPGRTEFRVLLPAAADGPSP